MPPVARRLFLPDGPGPAGAGQALVSQPDGTLAWGSVPVPTNSPAAGQVLTGTAGGGSQWQPNSGFPSALGRAQATAAQTLATSGWNVVNLNSLSWPAVGGLVLSNHALIVPTAGYYDVKGAISVSFGATPATLAVGIGQNSTIADTSRGNQVSNLNTPGLVVSDLLSCAAGDAISLLIYDSNAANTDSLNITAVSNYLSAVRVA